MICDYLQNNLLVTDGATGTYYTQLTSTNIACELANLTQPDLVQQMHRDYLQAGAQLLRTNTFSANTIALQIDRTQLADLLLAAFHNAQIAAANSNCFIAANIGPIPNNSEHYDLDRSNLLSEYHYIIDIFLNAGAEIFNFETFSDLELLPEITAYIKTKASSAFVLAQITPTIDGFTRQGISLERISEQLRNTHSIDAYGFNCGVGPTHLAQLLQPLTFQNDLVAALPNAGYPEIINQRTVYLDKPEYFAQRMLRLKALGIKILGGCCGTTPRHIAALVDQLDKKTPVLAEPKITSITETLLPPKIANSFAAKLQQGKFVIAAELDPPFDTSVNKLINGAAAYKEAGVDIVTIADSPLAKARVDSCAIAAKLKRELDIETLPHLCCRDKNLNAIKSTVLAAHIEDIRNVLAVTGDPLPAAANEIKNVFNVNSLGLIKYLRGLNEEIFSNDPLTIGAALNLNVRKKELEVARMEKKIAQGASFFLTQPIFDEATIDFLAQMKPIPGIKILAGILPLVSRRNALFLQNELPGITIPDEIVTKFNDQMDRTTAEAVGVQLALELAQKIKPLVDGFYFMTPFNRTSMIVELIKKLAIGSRE